MNKRISESANLLLSFIATSSVGETFVAGTSERSRSYPSVPNFDIFTDSRTVRSLVAQGLISAEYKVGYYDCKVLKPIEALSILHPYWYDEDDQWNRRGDVVCWFDKNAGARSWTLFKVDPRGNQISDAIYFPNRKAIEEFEDSGMQFAFDMYPDHEEIGQNEVADEEQKTGYEIHYSPTAPGWQVLYWFRGELVLSYGNFKTAALAVESANRDSNERFGEPASFAVEPAEEPKQMKITATVDLDAEQMKRLEALAIKDHTRAFEQLRKNWTEENKAEEREARAVYLALRAATFTTTDVL